MHIAPGDPLNADHSLPSQAFPSAADLPTTDKSMDQRSSGYWLPGHIRISPNASGAVVLDLQRNRYFGIGQKEIQAITRVVGNLPPNSTAWPQQSMEESLALAARLATAGLLTTEPHQGGFIEGVIDLEGDLSSVGHEIEVPGALHAGHVWLFARSCLWAKWALRRWSLYRIAQSVAQRKQAGGGAFDLHECAALVGIFRRLRPMAFTAQDQCLFHALTLVRFLAFHKVFPSWVIGVRMRPWGAHSWVQHHTLLLDALPEEVCEYSPILTI